MIQPTLDTVTDAALGPPVLWMALMRLDGRLSAPGPTVEIARLATEVLVRRARRSQPSELTLGAELLLYETGRVVCAHARNETGAFTMYLHLSGFRGHVAHQHWRAGFPAPAGMCALSDPLRVELARLAAVLPGFRV